MKNLSNSYTSYVLYFVFTFLAVSFSSCSNDDDDINDEDEILTGTITTPDQTISDNTITVQSVMVGQDSWLVAVLSDEQNSNNFIAGPVKIEEGTQSNITLELDEDANLDWEANEEEIVLKLYAEDDDGILGEWDSDDDPIMDASGGLVTETITITMEESTPGDFNSFDENQDGSLDMNEFGNTYENDFSAWDTDADGSLNDEEFYTTTFGNTDADDDDVISEDEWNTGYAGMYGNYVEEGDFSTWDADADGVLNSDEWNQGFGDTELYGTYDSNADDMISDTEWDEGLFGDWDTNDDDLIDEDEYNAYGSYVVNW